MRAYLLTTTAAVALLAATSVHAQDATWLLNPGSGNFNTAGNWTPTTVPTGTAFFGATNVPNLTFSPFVTNVGGWTFNAGAPAYTFTLGGANTLSFNGAGIVINAGSATINNFISLIHFIGSSSAGSAVINNAASSFIDFSGSSTAGNAVINNSGAVSFVETSTAGAANITNKFIAAFANASTAGNATITNAGFLQFTDTSTAGNATVQTTNGGLTQFFLNASGGQARFSTDAGGTFGIAGAAGPVTVGSIEGASQHLLGANQLTTGGNNLSTTVSGVIDGVGGSLIKTGAGIMTLSGVNTYTGATTVNAGGLIVDGSIASSSLTTVNSGAALIGSGTVGSSLVNAGGFLVPGPVGVPGTMTVAGNLAFQSGAFYVVQLNPTPFSRHPAWVRQADRFRDVVGRMPRSTHAQTGAGSAPSVCACEDRLSQSTARTEAPRPAAGSDGPGLATPRRARARHDQLTNAAAG
jgi:autotransporter-associated beta strand protein